MTTNVTFTCGQCGGATTHTCPVNWPPRPQPAQTRHTVDTTTSDQLDRLYERLKQAEREVERLTDMAVRYSDRAIENGQRAEKAEAALTAFRDQVQAITDEARGGIRQQLGDALAVLDQHGQTPA